MKLKNGKIVEATVKKVARKAEKGYTRLFLNLGKTDGFYANQIVELINRNLKKSIFRLVESISCRISLSSKL